VILLKDWTHICLQTAPQTELVCCRRIYITFEELPVQNIAVGNSIMRFATMHTAKSVDNIAGVWFRSCSQGIQMVVCASCLRTPSGMQQGTVKVMPDTKLMQCCSLAADTAGHEQNSTRQHYKSQGSGLTGHNTSQGRAGRSAGKGRFATRLHVKSFHNTTINVVEHVWIALLRHIGFKGCAMSCYAVLCCAVQRSSHEACERRSE
jgi:hypothetical protein